MSDHGYQRYHDDQERVYYGQWLAQLGVIPARKSGRCSNGMESDKGTIIHAVPTAAGELGAAS